MSVVKPTVKRSCRYILASLLFGAILVSPACIATADIDEPQDQNFVPKISFCDDEGLPKRRQSKRLLYVSTLDGKLSALDMTQNGKLEWTVDTGEPLLSSSIHRLELSTNGKWVRMIPSLSGSIYKFDGDTIEAIKIRAEDLLKSSFKFSDEIVISGGIESKNYGVSTKTGQILYECSIKGCTNETSNLNLDIPENEKHNPILDDTMILARKSQTIRAFDPRTGIERWNFSIGQHELELMKSTDCHTNAEEEELNSLILDLEFRAIIPEGVICAFSKKNPNNILWMHRFSFPIVSAWMSNLQDIVEPIDLFSGVEWLWNGHMGLFTHNDPEKSFSPSIYLGMYDKQPYIQESITLRQLTEEKRQNEATNLITDDSRTYIFKIPFRPYPATREALALIEDHSEGSAEEEQTIEKVSILKNEPQNTLATSVLYASEYVNGNGFYFYTSHDLNETQKAVCGMENETSKKGELLNGNSTDKKVVNLAAWMYGSWINGGKEILFTMFIIYTVYLIATKFHRQERGYLFVEKTIEVPVPYGREAKEGRDYSISKESSSESNHSEESFQSRFSTDFNVVQVLGKGGFGVVFAAKNKIDDCQYAIKRIVLPNKKESRDRVMREVRTLANCEHQNIVRYFHAWIETPPPGWQEQQDKRLKEQELLSTSIDICETPTDISSPPDFNKALSSSAVQSNYSKLEKQNDWLLNLNQNHFNTSDLNSISRHNGEITEDDTSGIQFEAHASNSNKHEYSDSFVVFDKVSDTESKQQPNDVVVPINETSTQSESISLSRNPIKNKEHHNSFYLDLTKNCHAHASINPSMKMYLYIQMQLCQKHSLKDWLSNNVYHERRDQVVPIFEQIVGAVEYVHLKGLIHRDLKPSNIFFALDGQIKIGDFGLVTDMSEEPTLTNESDSNSSKNSGKHTQQVGTKLYMSPEQVAGLPYNYKVDIYSLGLILFELLVTFSTEMERINILKGIRINKYPEDFQQIFNKEYELLKLMLSNNPSDRPTTIGIRARPPLLHSVSTTDNHFELPPRQRRESQNNTLNQSSSFVACET